MNSPDASPPLRGPAVVRPIAAFLRTEAAGGVVLLLCAVAALAWANSPYAAGYFQLWQAKLTLGTAAVGLSKPLLLWVNDGLMAIFFLVVGLEIKREVLGGELSSPRGAALPLLAALGGMIVPALLYLLVATQLGAPGARRGWAVPMATDIAFALGILALLGSRAPAGLKVFLAALAIADDLGAVLVIAFFFTAGLSLAALAWAGAFLAALVVANRAGVRALWVYLPLGVGLWVGVLKSGIHPTIAGVLLAMTIPAAGRRRDHAEPSTPAELATPQADARTTSPLRRLERALHPWVAFGIMPLFALANAGVALRGEGAGLRSPIALATMLGLFAGKQLGVFGFAWLAVRAGLARLPGGATWPQLYGVACLCGIGFTMSLFIAGLAFPAPADLDGAKRAVLTASAASAAMGFAVLTFVRRTPIR